MQNSILTAYLSCVLLMPAQASANAINPPSQFIAGAREGLAQQIEAHSKTWNFGKEQNWSVDLEMGLIVFLFANGVSATAPIQVVGTYNKADGTFLWGWDHPSVPQPLSRHALLAKVWGQKNNVTMFTTRKVQCSEDDAWGFAAVANRLAGANGVYRAQTGSTLVFMTFEKIELKTSKP